MTECDEQEIFNREVRIKEIVEKMYSMELKLTDGYVIEFEISWDECDNAFLEYHIWKDDNSE